MAPPPPIVIDAKAVSGITGLISLACWIIVFAPQIYENYRRKSSEGLSLLFVILWLAGDVFNVLGSVIQGVLPTMIILAIYYTFADIVLLWQCLLYGSGTGEYIHLSPANPIGDDVLDTVLSRESGNDQNDYDYDSGMDALIAPESAKDRTKDFLMKTLMVVLVVGAGMVGWYITLLNDYKHPGEVNDPKDMVYDPLAQFFGWLCAALYLGSRVPQILLNYERKLCDGISFMFFLFACLGNLTYVVSILSIGMDWHYLWINSSWLAGLLGTLFLDFAIFVQFFMYTDGEEEGEGDEENSRDQSPLPSGVRAGAQESYASIA